MFVAYSEKQHKKSIESGAEIVYVFDTNAVQLEQNYFLKSYLPQIKQHLFDPFKSKVAYFSKNNAIHTISNVNTFWDSRFRL